MSLINTNLLEMVGAFNKRYNLPNETFRPTTNYGNWQVFQAQQSRADRMIPQNEYSAVLASSYDRTIELINLTSIDTSLTGGNLRVQCSLSGEEGVSGKSPVVFKPYRMAFEMQADLNVNNEISYMAYYQQKFEENLNKLLKEVDTDAGLAILAGKNATAFTNFIGNIQYGATGEAGVDRLATVPDRVNYNDFRSLKAVYTEAEYMNGLIDMVVPSQQMGTIASIDMFGNSNQFNQSNGFNGLSFWLTDNPADSPTIYTQPFIHGFMIPSGFLGYMNKMPDIARGQRAWRSMTDTTYIAESLFPVLNVPCLVKISRECRTVNGTAAFFDIFQWEFSLGFITPNDSAANFMPIVAFEAE
jgi:hypothetical protein